MHSYWYGGCADVSSHSKNLYYCFLNAGGFNPCLTGIETEVQMIVASSKLQT